MLTAEIDVNWICARSKTQGRLETNLSYQQSIFYVIVDRMEDKNCSLVGLPELTNHYNAECDPYIERKRVRISPSL